MGRGIAFCPVHARCERCSQFEYQPEKSSGETYSVPLRSNLVFKFTVQASKLSALCVNLQGFEDGLSGPCADLTRLHAAGNCTLDLTDKR